VACPPQVRQTCDVKGSRVEMIRLRSAARIVVGISLLAFCLLGVAADQAWANCQSVLAGKSFWIRLQDPVASYSSKPGTRVRALLIQSPECDGWPVFPAGLEVDGEVVAARKVGLGLIHDTAFLEVQFNRIVSANGEILPIASEVVEIDNAREAVRRGVIRGIRATNTPQGRITSGLIHLPTYNPYGDVTLMVYRALTVLPEPEIYLPPGTDLRLQLNVPLYVGGQPEVPRVSFAMDEYERGEVEMMLKGKDARTMTGKGKEADLVNMLLVGSGAELTQAFRASGWVESDKTSTKSVFRQMGAFLTYSNYPTAPISEQYLDGKGQNWAWQKSFNAYGKREHLRIWEQPERVQGQTAWLGAYTRETSAALSVKNKKFIHHIERNLDEGVNMLVRDLSLSGCVKAVHLLPRAELPQLMTNATGDEMRTDGMLTVVELQSCESPGEQFTTRNPLIPIRPKSRVTRYLRTQILCYKSDVVRGNILYSVFDLLRMGLHSLRHRHDVEAEDDGAPLSPVSPQTLFPQFAVNGVVIEK
jgi:hypothetical protein